MPPRKLSPIPLPHEATTVVVRRDTIDDLRDLAPLIPKLDPTARELLRESRMMLAATMRSLTLSPTGEFGIMVDRIGKYLTDHPE